MARTLFIFVAIVVLVAGLFEWESAHYHASGPKAVSGQQTIVIIPPGTGVAAIGNQLAAAGVVDHGWLYQLGVRLRGKGRFLKAGEYAVPSKASMADITRLLISGRVVMHRLTAAEGLTSQMIYDLVKNDRALSGDPGPVPPEGSLLPETYLFPLGTKRAALLERMHRAQTEFLDSRWQHRASGLPFRTKEQAIILASIVEKETAIAGERRHIAAVFINRLNRGMKLQSDPTIIYGLTKGYPLGRPILESEIEAATPFNTYVIDALPPTPICNPGMDSIRAVLKPMPSSDLYFVANGSGGHDFAATNVAHEKNVAKWRRIEHQKVRHP